MFHPAANRLAGFLEISALSIALAQSGGAQYKAGLLRIESIGNKGPFGKRGTSWKEKKKQRWCAVRESYLVVVEEMGEVSAEIRFLELPTLITLTQLAVHDVFMIDTDFKIERPKRYYRQGLNLLTHPEVALEEERAERHRRHDQAVESAGPNGSSMKARLSRIFHVGHRDEPEASGSGQAASSVRPGASDYDSPSSPDSSEDEGERLARRITPILDPSTNTNPLLGPDGDPAGKNGGAAQPKKKQKKQQDVSKHTFYIENSQMRLKLYARNEVGPPYCSQMLVLTQRLEANAPMDRCSGEGCKRVALYGQESL